MFHKARIHFLGWPATLTPIKDELGAHGLGKDNIYPGLRQNIEGILAGHPVPAKGQRLINFKGWGSRRLTLLMLAPSSKHKLSKLGIDLSPLPGKELCRSALDKLTWDAVVQAQQLFHGSRGLPCHVVLRCCTECRHRCYRFSLVCERTEHHATC